MRWQVARVAPALPPILGPLFHTPAHQATNSITASRELGLQGYRSQPPFPSSRDALGAC